MTARLRSQSTLWLRSFSKPVTMKYEYEPIDYLLCDNLVTINNYIMQIITCTEYFFIHNNLVAIATTALFVL